MTIRVVQQYVNQPHPFIKGKRKNTDHLTDHYFVSISFLCIAFVKTILSIIILLAILWPVKYTYIFKASESNIY